MNCYFLLYNKVGGIMKMIFLLNRFSLKDKLDDVVSRVQRLCNHHHFQFKIEINSLNESTEDILKRYQKTHYMIIAIGGDGTLNRVLNGVVGTKNILGFIPYGTGNDFYKTCRDTLKDGITDIDLCKINHRYFINVVCFGIDADIGNNDQVVHSKWIPEKQRYNFSLISHFFHYRSRKMRICYDKHTEESFYTTVVVCNGRYYGGGYRVGYHSDLTDGKCELYLIQNMKKIMMAKLIAGMKKGKHETSSYTKKVPITMCRISSDEEISCNVDGEKLTSKDFQIEIIPKGISLYYDSQLIEEFNR